MMIPEFSSILDAGCGHGEFTLKMGRLGTNITGFDNSIEMINIAKSILGEANCENVKFVYCTTKEELPFYNEQFELIYNRRGPTSILNHSRILTRGGTILGIHSGALEKVKERLHGNGFINVEIQEYQDAIYYFPNEMEFAKFLTGTPGNPDYTIPTMSNELQQKIKQNTINGNIGFREYKYIWKANRP
ncbi:Mg-protoporphyrin IX methyl transferase [compost metagenome]